MSSTATHLDILETYRARLADIRSRNGYHLADLSEYTSAPDNLTSAGSVWLTSTVRDVTELAETVIRDAINGTIGDGVAIDATNADDIRSTLDAIDWTEEVSELFNGDFGAAPIYTSDIIAIFGDLALYTAFDDLIEEYGTVELNGKYGSDTLSVLWRAIDWTGHDIARHVVDELTEAIETDLGDIEA